MARNFVRVAAMVLLFSAFFQCKQNTENAGSRGVDSLKVAENITKLRQELNATKKEALIDTIIKGKVRAGFNGSVLVAQKGIEIYKKSFGLADFENNIANTPQTHFQLASLSKTFTAVAVMQLVERGLLSLDLTVQDYYPEFPYPGVTIRSLLSHRSGLPYYEYLMDKEVRQKKLYPNNQDMMRWFATVKPTPKAYNLPDHFFSYNNTNFAILAALVEKASGKSFGKYLKENLLDPLEMYDTFTADAIVDTARSPLTSYGYQHNRKIPKDHFDYIIGDKSVYSTVEDLLKWYQAIKDERILKKESLREMYTPRSFEHPGLRNYGYGFRLWVNEKQQTEYIYHTGWWKGYNTIMFFDLREDFVIILLSNRLNRSVYNIKEIIDVLHEGKRLTSVEDNILDQ